MWDFSLSALILYYELSPLNLYCSAWYFFSENQEGETKHGNDLFLNDQECAYLECRGTPMGMVGNTKPGKPQAHD